MGRGPGGARRKLALLPLRGDCAAVPHLHVPNPHMCSVLAAHPVVVAVLPKEHTRPHTALVGSGMEQRLESGRRPAGSLFRSVWLSVHQFCFSCWEIVVHRAELESDSCFLPGLKSTAFLPDPTDKSSEVQKGVIESTLCT